MNINFNNAYSSQTFKGRKVAIQNKKRASDFIHLSFDKNGHNNISKHVPLEECRQFIESVLNRFDGDGLNSIIKIMGAGKNPY